MKALLPFAVAVAALGLSSCCCMFSAPAKADYVTVQKKVCGRKHVVVDQVWVPGDPGPKGGMAKGGMYQPVEREVVRYKEVKKKVRCRCIDWFCPDRDCCGTTGPMTIARASAQGWSGSPHVGLIPTMKKLAP